MFQGRARRKEYWYYWLFYLLLYGALLAADFAIGTYIKEADMGWLSGIFLFVSLLPTISVSVRRLHDTNRSGLWLLLGFVPCGGVIVQL